MDKVTRSSASSAEETAAAAEEINGLSAMFQESIDQLKLLTRLG